MNHLFAVNGESNSLPNILTKVEKLAKEFAFNLEFVEISVFFKANNIGFAEIQHDFDMLSYYLDRAYQLDLPPEVVLRVKSSHKFLSDSIDFSRHNKNLLTDNSFVWLNHGIV